MTSAQLIQNIRFLLDKNDSLNYPNFTDPELYLVLNKAQIRLIKQKYGGTNTKRTSFEESQKRDEDLKAIVKNVVLTPNANTSSNIDTTAVFVDLPTDHWLIVQERVRISYLDCNNTVQSKTAKVDPIQHDDFDVIMEDPFNRPNEDRVLRLMAENKVELITGLSTTTVTQYQLRYIRKPLDITATQTSELSDFVHDELVDEAVKILLEGIESPRVQTNLQISTTNE